METDLISAIFDQYVVDDINVNNDNTPLYHGTDTIGLWNHIWLSDCLTLKNREILYRSMQLDKKIKHLPVTETAETEKWHRPIGKDHIIHASSEKEILNQFEDVYLTQWKLEDFEPVVYPRHMHLEAWSKKAWVQNVDNRTADGYSRPQDGHFLQYGNPFDNGLVFRGLLDVFPSPTKDVMDKEGAALETFHCLLDHSDPSGFTNDYLNTYRKYVTFLATVNGQDMQGENTESEYSNANSILDETPEFVDESCMALWEKILSAKSTWSDPRGECSRGNVVSADISHNETQVNTVQRLVSSKDEDVKSLMSTETFLTSVKTLTPVALVSPITKTNSDKSAEDSDGRYANSDITRDKNEAQNKQDQKTPEWLLICRKQFEKKSEACVSRETTCENDVSYRQTVSSTPMTNQSPDIKLSMLNGIAEVISQKPEDYVIPPKEIISGRQTIGDHNTPDRMSKSKDVYQEQFQNKQVCKKDENNKDKSRHTLDDTPSLMINMPIRASTEISDKAIELIFSTQPAQEKNIEMGRSQDLPTKLAHCNEIKTLENEIKNQNAFTLPSCTSMFWDHQDMVYGLRQQDDLRNPLIGHQSLHLNQHNQQAQQQFQQAFQSHSQPKNQHHNMPLQNQHPRQQQIQQNQSLCQPQHQSFEHCHSQNRESHQQQQQLFDLQKQPKQSTEKPESGSQQEWHRKQHIKLQHIEQQNKQYEQVQQPSKERHYIHSDGRHPQLFIQCQHVQHQNNYQTVYNDKLHDHGQQYIRNLTDQHNNCNQNQQPQQKHQRLNQQELQQLYMHTQCQKSLQQHSQTQLQDIHQHFHHQQPHENQGHLQTNHLHAAKIPNTPPTMYLGQQPMIANQLCFIPNTHTNAGNIMMPLMPPKFILPVIQQGPQIHHSSIQKPETCVQKQHDEIFTGHGQNTQQRFVQPTCLPSNPQNVSSADSLGGAATKKKNHMVLDDEVWYFNGIPHQHVKPVNNLPRQLAAHVHQSSNPPRVRNGIVFADHPLANTGYKFIPPGRNAVQDHDMVYSNYSDVPFAPDAYAVGVPFLNFNNNFDGNSNITENGNSNNNNNNNSRGKDLIDAFQKLDESVNNTADVSDRKLPDVTSECISGAVVTAPCDLNLDPTITLTCCTSVKRKCLYDIEALQNGDTIYNAANELSGQEAGCKIQVLSSCRESKKSKQRPSRTLVNIDTSSSDSMYSD